MIKSIIFLILICLTFFLSTLFPLTLLGFILVGLMGSFVGYNLIRTTDFIYYKILRLND